MQYIIKKQNTAKLISENFSYNLCKKNYINKLFTVKINGAIYRIHYDSIYFFEKNDHKIKLFFDDSCIDFYGSLKKIKNNLISYNNFVQCHQGYICNINKVYCYKDNYLFFKKINRYIPVSKNNDKLIRNILLNT